VAVLEEGDRALIAAALGDVATARRMTEVARTAGLGAGHAYKTLSKEGDPRLSNLWAPRKRWDPRSISPREERGPAASRSLRPAGLCARQSDRCGGRHSRRGHAILMAAAILVPVLNPTWIGMLVYRVLGGGQPVATVFREISRRSNNARPRFESRYFKS
jgi:hypothetical protein